MSLDVETATWISLILTSVGLVAASLRMLLGPSAADRVVALDLVTVLLVAISSLLALQTGLPAYLDPGLALALVGFLATVALARYMEASAGEEASASGETSASERDDDGSAGR